MKKEKIKDYVQLKQKVGKQLKRKSDRELQNLKIELTIKISKKGTSWDNYIASRLAFIAIIISVITIVLQYYPNDIQYFQYYIKGFLFFGVLYIFTFTYKDEKIEDRKIFLKLVLDCLNEILEEKK